MKSFILKVLVLVSVVTLFISGCGDSNIATEKKNKLLIYCGITMIKPMKVIAKRFEKDNPNCKVLLVQGGSNDLYRSLKDSRKGDLYLPGSSSYIKNNQSDGILGKSGFMGYNRAALIVQKGNPLNISADINELLKQSYSVALCDYRTGSIGRMTKKILDKAQIFDKVMRNTAFLTTDSRNLTKGLIDDKVDIVINWRATAFWPENKDKVEAIDLPENIAPKKKLLLTTLTFTKHKELTKKFFKFATSETGRQIFKEYGF